MHRITPYIKRAIQLWDALQVELHGHYSFERVQSLDVYMKSTSVLRMVIVCLASPLACFLLTTLVDCVPLAPVEAGTRANYVHWI
uniref:Uncharacterized protein n=1 Tax=Globisporangium ultimum (strain ATCC 200006 / CBS 805.95 / DAOM BR144) TaxID=431595 RepID=K3WY57_GLOUD